MSVNTPLVILRDIREFTAEAAQFIVLEVARGASVKELHECHEDKVPSPLVVNRWRRQVPQFDMLMKEAEIAKAEGLADEVLKIADDDKLQAAQARNAMDARKWLSERLGGQKGGAGPGGVNVSMNVRLTDEQLMAIASGRYGNEEALVLEGTVESDPLDEREDAAADGAAEKNAEKRDILGDEDAVPGGLREGRVSAEEVSADGTGRAVGGLEGDAGWDWLSED